ncbi:MAG: hypothetical protein E6Q68_01660 [Polynucleobacter sp.]|nr:MAG: hypothetical protein E6Q68_01660 [Polynucleobacter sp.]
MPLDNFYNVINALQDFNVEEEAVKIVSENREKIIMLLQKQLAAGIDGNGKKVKVNGRTIYRGWTTKKKRGKIGLAGVTSHITNYMEGDFYSMMKVIVSGTDFQITSDAPHFYDILNQSGTVIMKLNKDSLQEFKNTILVPELKRRLDDAIQAANI